MAELILPRRRLLAIALAPVGAAALSRVPGAIAAPGSVELEIDDLDTSASSYCPTGEELEFLELINDYRADNGLGGLRISATLGAAAEHHSRDMAKYNYFSHTLYNGRTWLQNIRSHGYTTKAATAENIAAGYRTAEKTFEQWRNSSGHNRNMLSAKYSAIGIGRASKRGSRYTYYWTTTFGSVFDKGPSC